MGKREDTMREAVVGWHYNYRESSSSLGRYQQNHASRLLHVMGSMVLLSGFETKIFVLMCEVHVTVPCIEI